MNWIASLLLVCGIPSLKAETITLFFSPLQQTVSVGSLGRVNVMAADLVDFAPPALGAYDFDILFNPAILSVENVTFGQFMGGSDAIESVASAGPGVLRLTGVSLLSAPQLVASQPGSFALSMVDFRVNALGTSDLAFAIHSLSDESASSVVLTKTEMGMITGVPEPPGSSLVLVPLVFLAFRRQLSAYLRR